MHMSFWAKSGLKWAILGANKSFFQIFTHVTSHKISEKFIEWIPRSEQRGFWSKIGAKMTKFRTILTMTLSQKELEKQKQN